MGARGTPAGRRADRSSRVATRRRAARHRDSTVLVARWWLVAARRGAARRSRAARFSQPESCRRRRRLVGESNDEGGGGEEEGASLTNVLKHAISAAHLLHLRKERRIVSESWLYEHGMNGLSLQTNHIDRAFGTLLSSFLDLEARKVFLT
jgi:hypothetical protein